MIKQAALIADKEAETHPRALPYAEQAVGFPVLTFPT